MPSMFETSAGKAIGYPTGFTPEGEVEDGGSINCNAPSGTIKRKAAIFSGNSIEVFEVTNNSFVDRDDIIVVNPLFDAYRSTPKLHAATINVDSGKFKVMLQNDGDQDIAAGDPIRFSFAILKNSRTGFQIKRED